MPIMIQKESKKTKKLLNNVFFKERGASCSIRSDKRRF